MKIEDQLKLVGKLLSDKVAEHKLTIVEIKSNTGMALNTIKSALAGNPCNINTYLSIAAMLNMTIFDFNQAITKEVKKESNPEVCENHKPVSKNNILRNTTEENLHPVGSLNPTSPTVKVSVNNHLAEEQESII